MRLDAIFAVSNFFLVIPVASMVHNIYIAVSDTNGAHSQTIDITLTLVIVHFREKF